jgi:hypothetical protein
MAGISLDFSSISICASTSPVSAAIAEHLPCFSVVEVVETALQRLAVERDDAGFRAYGRATQIGGVFAKDLFDLCRAESVQDIADGRMRGRAFPIDLEGFVQPLP